MMRKAKSWRFGQPQNGWIIVVHGLGEYSERHKELIEKLVEEGFAVYTFDWPGHGESDGKRGYTSIEEGMNIIDELTDRIDEKPFLFGHSLGGLTVIRYGELHPDRVKGVIASSPSLKVSPDIPSFLVPAVKFLSNIAPKTTIDNGIEPEDISRDEEIRERYEEDDMVHSDISLRLADSLFSNMKRAHEDSDKIDFPLLLLCGTEDEVTPIQGSLRLAREVDISEGEKKVEKFEGAYHEIFNDPEYEEEFQKSVIDWLEEHTEGLISTSS